MTRRWTLWLRLFVFFLSKREAGVAAIMSKNGEKIGALVSQREGRLPEESIRFRFFSKGKGSCRKRRKGFLFLGFFFA